MKNLASFICLAILAWASPAYGQTSSDLFEMALHWYESPGWKAESMIQMLEGQTHAPSPTPTAQPSPTPPPQTMSNGGTGITMDDEGNLYLVDFISLYRLRSDGTTELYKDLTGILTSQSANPQICYEPVQDALFVSSPAQLARIDMKSGQAALFAESISDISIRRDFGGMVPDGNGNLIVARTDGVFSYDDEGTPTSLGYPLNMSLRPVDVARAPDGTLFMTAILNPRRINDDGVLFRKLPGGTWARVLQFFAGPYYIAYGDGNRLYVSNRKADVVSEVDTTTLEVTRFYQINFWPRGLIPQSGGGVLVSHVAGPDVFNSYPALTALTPTDAEDVSPAQIALTHDTLDGHTQDVGITGINLDIAVSAHNSIKKGDTRLLVSGAWNGVVTATIPLVSYQGESLGIPEGDIQVFRNGRPSNKVAFEGPRPGEMSDTVIASTNRLENPPSHLAKGSWLRIQAGGNLYLQFPDRRYENRVLWFGENFFMKFADLETVQLEVPPLNAYSFNIQSGTSGRGRTLEVDPAEDFEWFWDGARIEIPAGTLPGVSPYQLTLVSSQVTPFAPAMRTGVGYSVEFDPEPSQLGHDIDLWMNYSAQEMGLESEGVGFGLIDEGAFFSVENTVIDRDAETVHWKMPAGSYVTKAKPESDKRHVHPNSYSVNTVLSFWSTWGLPAESYQLVGHDFIVQGDSDVDPGYALACLGALRNASQTYVDLGFSAPDHVQYVWIENLGANRAVGGYTTPGVFGNSWMKLHDSLELGDGNGLDWNAAHELFHVFQREITINFTTHWYDEATAQWAASKVYPNSTYYITGTSGINEGCDFPSQPIPESYSRLNSFYSTDQEYAAMTMMKFIDEKRGHSTIESLLAYDAVEGGDKFRESLALLMNQTIEEFCFDFGKAYWSLSFDRAFEDKWPLEPKSVDLGDAQATVALNHTQQSLSTSRPTLKLENVGSQMVVVVSPGSAKHTILVYGDPNVNRYEPSEHFIHLGSVTRANPDLLVNVGGYRYIKFISINTDTSSSSSINGTATFSDP
jgi:hypothetical protein